MWRKVLVAGLVWGLFSVGAEAHADQLLVGAASADVTPSQPVSLDGQADLRVSKKVDTPITANVLALESRDGRRSLDAAVMVSCDFVMVSDTLLNKIYRATQRRLPSFDQKKVFVNATHTHTAPVTRPGVYAVPQEGVVQVEEYCDFAADRIAEAIEKAWKGRRPGSFTWGLGHAAVAENRRATYADGHAEMYGKTNRPDFRGLEGYEDHDVGSLFFWNETGKLLAIGVNVSCPSQEVEGLKNLNADFWHPVRESLRKRYGQDVCILGWPGAAGDQSPHLMYRSAAEHRMCKLRNIPWIAELARRIVAAVDDTFEAVKNDRHANVPLIHKTELAQLPMWLVSEAEYANAQAVLARQNPGRLIRRQYERLVERYERQKNDPRPVDATEIHVLRIGDVAICTNTYELFTDFGVQIKARSRAAQTFVIQLGGGGSSYYLPTERAARGGGYSAFVRSCLVGPEGGQILVERTVALIDSLWPKANEKKK